MPYACPVCSNEDYDEDDGLFFCTECGTQSQELIVQEATLNTEISARHEVKGAKGESQASKQLPKADLGRPWTIYEAYQVIILAQADALVTLGAKEELKNVVFTIWANYLSKLGVAFCKNEKLVPDIVMQTRVGRLRELHRGTLTNPLNRRKKPFLDQPFPDQEMSEGPTSALSGEEFYDEDRPEDEADDNIVFLNEDDEDDQGFEEDCVSTRNSRYYKAVHSPEWMNMKKTLSFCYIGLMLTDPQILPFDVVRWVYEGKVPFLSVTHLLPADMVLSAGDQALFESGKFDTAVFITEINRLLIYLELDNLPPPALSKLISRFIMDLSLPDELADLSQRLTQRIPFTSNDTKTCYRKQEVLAMSYIILSLKLIFGLDDSTEWAHSKYSEQVQGLLKCDKNVFIWDDWKRFLSLKSSQEFNAYSELTKDISKSKLQHLDELLECYKKTVSDERKFTTKHVLNQRQRIVRSYQPGFREALRKPLEIAQERYGHAQLSSDQGNVGDEDWSTKSHKFSSSTISHLTDIPKFQSEIGELSHETEKELKRFSKIYSVPTTQVSQYCYLKDADSLDSNRHENYIWLLQLASQTIDCSVLDLDKLVVRLTDYIVITSSEDDTSGLLCWSGGVVHAGDKYMEKRKRVK